MKTLVDDNWIWFVPLHFEGWRTTAFTHSQKPNPLTKKSCFSWAHSNLCCWWIRNVPIVQCWHERYYLSWGLTDSPSAWVDNHLKKSGIKWKAHFTSHHLDCNNPAKTKNNGPGHHSMLSRGGQTHIWCAQIVLCYFCTFPLCLEGRFCCM